MFFSFSMCLFDVKVGDGGRGLALVAFLIELISSCWIDEHSILVFLDG